MSVVIIVGVDYVRMKVGRVKNLERVSLASLRLKNLTSAVVTTSTGREFHGWTARTGENVDFGIGFDKRNG